MSSISTAVLAPTNRSLEELERLDTLNPCRVLIVDDDDLVRAKLSAFLRAAKYEVVTAASGEEALRAMAAQHCHIVLTDWEMPDMDGLSLCRCLRVSLGAGYVYVIMLTVRKTRQDVLTGFGAGADDYLVKGASAGELLARVEVGRRIVHVERSLRASRANRELSFIDPVSGARNLRYFTEQLRRELERSRRYRHPLAVLGCTIDNFERARNRFGHSAAAEVLKTFVTRAESCIRSSVDWLARVDLDEFMLVLPETGAAGTQVVSRRIRQALVSVKTRAGVVPIRLCVALAAMDESESPGSSTRIEELINTASRRSHGTREITREVAVGTPSAVE